MSAPDQVTAAQVQAAYKAVVSSSIGATLEWFDIIVYASFAPVIARVFFPESDPGFALILTFATFVISYVIRPLGGLVLGSHSDRKGRRAALSLTLMLMMAGTLIMALAPSHDMVGAWGGLMTYAAFGALILAWPLFRLMISTPAVPTMIFVIAVLGTIMVFYHGHRRGFPGGSGRRAQKIRPTLGALATCPGRQPWTRLMRQARAGAQVDDGHRLSAIAPACLPSARLSCPAHRAQPPQIFQVRCEIRRYGYDRHLHRPRPVCRP